jgi:hypothetical protein
MLPHAFCERLSEVNAMQARRFYLPVIRRLAKKTHKML